MTRINAIRNAASSVAWGKNIAGDINAYVFAAVLIICSVAVGCSSDKPKPVTSNNQTPVIQPSTPAPTPAPIMQAENKPAPKKPVQHKKPATVNYADKMYGVTFEYPRRYAIETGDAATQLVASNPLPMNFVQPGGVALAAVELPETNYINTDFSSAYFNVSVNKTLSADQCGEFAVPQQKSMKSDSSAPSMEVSKQDSTPKSDVKPDATTSSTQPMPSAELKSDSKTEAKADVKSDVKSSATSSDMNSNSKLLLGDMELRATEAVTGEGTRQSDSKYFHVYQNGACYEFALNVTTDASEEGLVKHVDRDRIFSRLEQILQTVKFNPTTPEVTAEAPAPQTPGTPAQ
jgi:hypothetical protein